MDFEQRKSKLVLLLRITVKTIKAEMREGVWKV